MRHYIPDVSSVGGNFDVRNIIVDFVYTRQE